MFLASAAVYAGGYRIGAQGQRALAMGHAGVGVVNSAETAFFNPSGLVYLEDKFTVSAGVTGVFSNVKWQNESTGQFAETDSPMGTPFYFHASYKINEWLAAGLTVTSPYGSTVEWEKAPGSFPCRGFASIQGLSKNSVATCPNRLSNSR